MKDSSGKCVDIPGAGGDGSVPAIIGEDGLVYYNTPQGVQSFGENDPNIPGFGPSGIGGLTGSAGQYQQEWEKLKTDKEKKLKDSQNPELLLQQALAGAIGSYFDILMRGGTGHEAGLAAKGQLVTGLVRTAQPWISQAIGGGFGGALLGALGGGLLGWGLSAALGLDKQGFDYDVPDPGPIANSAQFQKQYTLPSSKYFFPSGRSNTGTFKQTNTFNITGGPKTGERVVRAISDFDILMQDSRGYA